MISDADYFYILQLFTFIIFLFQAVNCFMISDALLTNYEIITKPFRIFKKVVKKSSA